MRMKTITLLLLVCALMVTLICTQNAQAAMKKQDFNYQTSEWAKQEVDTAYELGFFTAEDIMDQDLTAPITRNEFRAVAMEFLRFQEQLVLLDQLADYYLAEKDENGKIKLAFQDKPDEFERMTDHANSTAHYLGLVEGRGQGVFDPDGLITREEAAVMLTRSYHVLDSEGLQATSEAKDYQDEPEISDWATDSTYALRDWNVMIGTAPGTFSPKGNYTREQCIVTFLRLYENAPVSRKNSNVPQKFTYDQIIACIDAYDIGTTPDARDIRYRTNSKWEGPKATAISQSVWGVMISEQKLYFVYQDGRVREFDIGIYNYGDDMLTDGIRIEDGRFSQDGEQFFCTAVEAPTKYQIAVDVETLKVEKELQPLSDDRHT